MELSIVASLYHSAPHLEDFVRRATAAAAAVTDAYELVLVNDGSPDQSLTVALALMKTNDRLRVVDLSKNYGHHQAMIAGLAHARGQRVLLIDSDLEEDPALLDRFWKRMQADPGLDVVYGIQAQRKGGWSERYFGRLYYTLLRWVSDIHYPPDTLTARLMNRRYVDNVLRYGEKAVDLWGIFSLVGFRQEAVVVEKGSKASTTYTLGRRLTMAVNTLTSVSNRPLIFIFLLGLAMTVVAFVVGAYLIVRQLFFSAYDVEGWTSILVSIWLVGGIIIFCLGVIGIYLSKVFLEVKNRPLYVVRQVYERPPS